MMKPFLTSTIGAALTAAPFRFSAGIAMPWIERLGWTLMHAVWQLSLLAIAAMVVNRFLKNRSARVRYLAAVICFSMMAIAPLVTWAFTEKADIGVSSVVDWTVSSVKVGAASRSSESDSNLAGC